MRDADIIFRPFPALRFNVSWQVRLATPDNRQNWSERMEFLCYLTPDGWTEDRFGAGEKCVAHYGHLEMDERRMLHQRFGFPPVVEQILETQPDSTGTDANVPTGSSVGKQ